MKSANQDPQKSKQLLVIDDDSGVVDYLTEMLTAHGYRVSGETHPQRALERLKTEHFDLLISDVEITGMRGLH